MYSSGYGYKPIIATLKEKGYKTKIGRDFTQASLHDILCNEKYTGIYVFNRASSKIGGKRNNHKSKDDSEIIKIPGGMPAIISAEIFEFVQKKMKNNKINAQNKAKEVYLLSSRIVCGCCGAAMVGHTSHSGRNKTKYSSYYCGERYRTKNCNQKPINKKFIEEIALRDIKQKLLNPKCINHLAEKLIQYYENSKREDKKDIKAFERRLTEIQKKLDNIVIAIADGLYNSSMKSIMDKLEQEKAEVTIMISESRSKAKATTLDKAMIVAYLQNDIEVLESKNPDDLKKIIQTYIEKVVIYEDYVEVFLVLFVHTIGGGEEN
jgi:site-specific DNA recombinase